MKRKDRTGIMFTRSHSTWNKFVAILSDKISRKGCDHSYVETRKTLYVHIEPKYDISISDTKTMEYFKKYGGYCDCEILFNVAHDPNI